jgi:hypothetical protein
MGTYYIPDLGSGWRLATGRLAAGDWQAGGWQAGGWRLLKNAV